MLYYSISYYAYTMSYDLGLSGDRHLALRGARFFGAVFRPLCVRVCFFLLGVFVCLASFQTTSSARAAFLAFAKATPAERPERKESRLERMEPFRNSNDNDKPTTTY